MASNTIIQCTSSSSHAIRTYDVFVSFRGETRNNFTGFLLEAVRRKGIDAFKDDKDIRKGESIAPELLQAIAGSRIFIVVFSKDYASSTFCLRELAHISDCSQTSQRRVLPIFYEVNPSEVRKQGGYYEEAFVEHEKRFKENKEKMEEVKGWREALTRVANLSGWDIQNKQQYAEIEDIIQETTNILGPKFSSLPNDNLVGMESCVKELIEVLHLGLVNNVRVVGISGMGGIGKTTLGRALYEKISHQYDFRCYIDDVSKIYRDSGTLGIQKQLLSQSLKEKNLEICNVSEGTCTMWARLRHARALIVLDNVDQDRQLKMFTGSRDTLLHECLGGGSKIIIISRDEHILRTYGVDDVYQVKPLDDEDVVNLFCKNAFKSNYITSDYEELTFDILPHVQGHPLAIEVLALSLCGGDDLQWRSALARLRESKKIMDVLRISFDELENKEKEIFLDIACFFNIYSWSNNAKEILDIRGFDPEYGLQVLISKSLITMTNGKIHMHRLLRDLGKCIVRENSPKKPREWSRLWDCQDLQKVMSDNMEAENLEAIVIDDLYNLPQTTMRADAISKMRNLKLLILGEMEFSGRLNNLSNELGYLAWYTYPFECLPPSFAPDKLVELNLLNSNIKQLWEGAKSLPNLRRLNLSYSENLIELPDFGEALNLEELYLEGCVKLRQINPSIGLLKKLTYLNLDDCENLESLPCSILGLNSLKYLSLFRCSKLYNIQVLDETRDAEHLKKLNIGEAPIHSQATSSYSRAHKDSVSCLLPSSPISPWMYELNLSFCNLLQIPDAIGNLRCLAILDLSGNNFATLPSLKKLSKLFFLNLQICKQLKYLPELPSRIDYPSPPRTKTVHAVHTVAGLYIFDCPQLVERERCTSMCFSWMIQLAQAHLRYELLDYPRLRYIRFGSVTPGSEIPRWFNNQHVGSSVSIDASSVICDNDWIGVACCAIFMLPRGKVLARHHSLALVLDEPDHIWQFFLSREQFMRQCDSKYAAYLDGLQWHFGKWYVPWCYLKVKKYGYRWVYKQDLELSWARKRKFLAIEQNEGRNQGKRSKGRISPTRREDAADSSQENTIKLLQNQFANMGL